MVDVTQSRPIWSQKPYFTIITKNALVLFGLPISWEEIKTKDSVTYFVHEMVDVTQPMLEIMHV